MSRFLTLLSATFLILTNIGDANAGFWSTKCAGRDIAVAYSNAKAIDLVKTAVRGNETDVRKIAQAFPGIVNTIEDGAVPPLLWAICADNTKGFKALLNAGADPNLASNGHGWGDGKGHGYKEDGSLIREGWSATMAAAGAGNPDFIKLALQYGGDPDAPKGSRPPNRPLILAASDGLLENIKILVAAGANVNVQHGNSSAPDDAIGGRGRFDIALWLVNHGYSYDLQVLASSAEVRTAIKEQQQNKEELIKLLRSLGAMFPASPAIQRAVKEREIPAADIEDIVLGRKSIGDYAKRATSGTP